MVAWGAEVVAWGAEVIAWGAEVIAWGAEVIVVTGHRPQALACLGVFVSERGIKARFPGGQPAPANAKEEGPQARGWFEWALNGQFLVQRTEVQAPSRPAA